MSIYSADHWIFEAEFISLIGRPADRKPVGGGEPADGGPTGTQWADWQ